MSNPVPPVGARVRDYLYGDEATVVGHLDHLVLVDDGARVRAVVPSTLDVLP